ncbi:MAG: hypothetical protein R3F31_08460 [Verrucomicrobiales bacterium]
MEYDNHLRAQFDKVPEPPPHGVKGADKITFFEDKDGDGTYEPHRCDHRPQHCPPRLGTRRYLGDESSLPALLSRRER